MNPWFVLVAALVAYSFATKGAFDVMDKLPSLDLRRLALVEGFLAGAVLLAAYGASEIASGLIRRMGGH